MTDLPDGFLASMRAASQVPPGPRRAEIRRIAETLRIATERLMSTGATADDLVRAAELAEAMAAALNGGAAAGTGHGGEVSLAAPLAAHPDGTSFFDNSPVIGRSNPVAPPLELEIVDGGVVGTVRFGAAYEGPPGYVHGGFVAAAFDDVLGMTQSLSGRPGMTGTLTIRYRRPTPLQTDLRFEGELLRVDGRKIFTEGRLFADGELRAEAEGIFISVDLAKMLQQRGQQGPGATA